MAEGLKYVLKYEHLVTVPDHPPGNSMAERHIKEVGAHLRPTLVNECWIKSK